MDRIERFGYRYLLSVGTGILGFVVLIALAVFAFEVFVQLGIDTREASKVVSWNLLGAVLVCILEPDKESLKVYLEFKVCAYPGVTALVGIALAVTTAWQYLPVSTVLTLAYMPGIVLVELSHVVFYYHQAVLRG